MSAERLYARLPAHIRARDAAEGYPLRALVDIMEDEFDVLHRDIAQLYDNAFIETCEEWAVAYIGDLLGARRLNPNVGEGFSLRAYVANQLAYRRAKGTAAVVEQAARDVAGHPARVVEYWRHIVQAQHQNHVRRDCPQTVDLRDADRARAVDTPFDPWAHNVDLRAIRAGLGRHLMPHVGVHLWRLQAAPLGFAFDGSAGRLGGVSPRPVPAGDGRYLLHPAGLDLQLFNRPAGEPEIAHLAGERDVPAALRRLPLVNELRARDAGTADATGWFGTQPVIEVRLDGATLPAERLKVAHLGEQAGGGWRRPEVAGEVVVDPVLGRLAVHPDDAGAVVEVAYAFGTPGPVGAGPWDRRASLATWRDEIAVPGAAAPWICAVTRRSEEHTDNPANGGPCVGSLAEAVARWNAAGNGPDARGLVVILDNATYDEPVPEVALAAGARLAVVAGAWPVTVTASGARYRLPDTIVASGRRPFLDAELRLAAGGGEGLVVVDGLMLAGGIGVVSGQLDDLRLRHTTAGIGPSGLGNGVRIEGGATLRTLAVDASVVGPVVIDGTVGSLAIRQTVVGEDRTADAGGGILSTAAAISAAGADLELVGATVFGEVTARTATIDGSIVTGTVRIARRQAGCVRYSFVPPGSATARRFRCQPDLALAAALTAKREATGDADATLTTDERATVVRGALPRLTASRIEHPAFAQLATACPPVIAEGGDGGTEMGVYGRYGGPLRRANLREVLSDTLRVGLEAGIFHVT